MEPFQAVIQRNRGLIILIVIVAIVATILRFPSLQTNPPWYTDETFYLNSAWGFIHGSTTLTGIAHWTFISPFLSILPLYHILVGVPLLFFGKSLLVARIITASIGVLTASSLSYMGWVLFRSRVASLVMGLTYATIPVLVVNNRWAFPQNITGILLLWATFLLWQYRATGRRVFEIYGYIVSGALLTSSVWCWGFLGAVFILYRGLKRNTAWHAVALILVMPVTALLIRALFMPAAFWTDILSYKLTVQNGGVDGIMTDLLWKQVVAGIGQFFSRDPLFFLAFIGLLFVRPNKFRIFLFSAFVLSASLLLIKRVYFSEWFYPGLIFTPPLLLGLGGGIVALKKYMKHQWPFVAIVVLLFSLYTSILHVRRILPVLNNGKLANLVTTQKFINTDSHIEVDQVVVYINTHTTATQFVIAPNTINWQLRARSVEAMWTACYEHQNEFGRLFKNRFPMPIGVHNASFLVDDVLFGGDHGLCEQQREEILNTAKTENWPVVLSTGRFQVYRNPNPINK